jgi:hypothetical protein
VNRVIREGSSCDILTLAAKLSSKSRPGSRRHLSNALIEPGTPKSSGNPLSNGDAQCAKLLFVRRSLPGVRSSRYGRHALFSHRCVASESGPTTTSSEEKIHASSDGQNNDQKKARFERIVTSVGYSFANIAAGRSTECSFQNLPRPLPRKSR